METFEVATPEMWLPLFAAVWLLAGIIAWRVVGATFGPTMKRLGRFTVALLLVAAPIIFLGANSGWVRVRPVEELREETFFRYDTMEVRATYDWEKHTYAVADIDYYDVLRSGDSNEPGNAVLTIAFKDGLAVKLGDRKTNYRKLVSYLERNGVHKRAPYERERRRLDRSPRQP